MFKPNDSIGKLNIRHRGESIRSLFPRKKSPANLIDGLDDMSKSNSMAIKGSGANTPLEKSIREESSEGGTPYLFAKGKSTKLNEQVERGLTESSVASSYSLASSFDSEVAAYHTGPKEVVKSRSPTKR